MIIPDQYIDIHWIVAALERFTAEVEQYAEGVGDQVAFCVAFSAT